MGDPVMHFEIVGADGERLGRFYSELFGWTVTPVEGTADGYRLVDTGGEGISGGIGSFPNVAAYLTFYVQVDDLEASIREAETRGGEVVMAPREVRPGLRAAMINDPEGNMVGMISPMDDSPAA